MTIRQAQASPIKTLAPLLCGVSVRYVLLRRKKTAPQIVRGNIRSFSAEPTTPRPAALSYRIKSMSKEPAVLSRVPELLLEPQHCCAFGRQRNGIFCLLDGQLFSVHIHTRRHRHRLGIVQN